jgi:pseudaminic acid cytidylyltransferase
MKIAIIPARSGSKRIKNKNIKFFCGKPIISIVIKKLLASKLFDLVVVSTDSEIIKNISINAGASVPFLRPKKLSGDLVDTSSVIKHALNWFKLHKINIMYACCVYPTSVFFTKKDILKALLKLRKKKFNFIISAKKINSNILRSFVIEKNVIKILNDRFFDFRTQDLPNNYMDAAQFYYGKRDSWYKSKIFGKKSSIVEIEYKQSVDIDTQDDWLQAEKLFKKRKIK